MVVLVASLGASQDAATTTDPAKAVIVTSDIPNFWRAFDDASRAATQKERVEVFKREYFLPGSDGLWGFIGGRIVSPSHLAKTADEHRAEYERVRAASLTIPSQVPLIVADFRRLKAFYPGAVFPNIYFVVGALNSGGTTVDGVGDIIGVDVPLASGSRTVAPTVAHETIHYNQHDADQQTLLDSTIYEGTADFLGDLSDGGVTTAETWSFGCSHENALWDLFEKQAGAKDDGTINSWLFSDKAPLGAPPFIGYWIGYRVVQTYYENAPDKSAAIVQILHIRNFQTFLDAAGYPKKKPPCVRIPRWR
ncbi:MAG: DUF2268 domain-containing putative Zn-dependent protease [Candidatus Baltobacteraceae bacterium]